MKSMPRWFLVPPAFAALLILGTLSMQGPADAARSTPPDPRQEPAAESSPAPAAGPATKRQTPPLPRAPDLLQTASALAGVLLLGVGGVLLLRRLRGTARAPRGAALLTLRQTLRLTARQAVHAIEFDDRLLLVGESERGLTLLDSGKLPERVADETEVLARDPLAAATAGATHSGAAGTTPHDAADDEGAVPKNLLIPRPSTPTRRLPNPPAVAPTPASAVGLADFRNLLQKAGRA